MPSNWLASPYALPLLLASLCAAALCVVTWRHRPTPGAGPLALLLLGVAQWTMSSGLEMASPTLTAKIFWANWQYLGIGVVPAAWLLFGLDYTRNRRFLTGSMAWLLIVEPLITLALALLEKDVLRGAFALQPVGGADVLAVQLGPWFWVHAVYSYLLLGGGAALLIVGTLRSPVLYRRQVATVLVAALLPWMANAVYIFGLGPWPHLDLTPFGLLGTGLAVVWGLFRLQLLDVVPVARHAVVDGLLDPVVVVSINGLIVDANPAATQLLDTSSERLIGSPADQALSAVPGWLDGRQDVESSRGGERRHFEPSRRPLQGRDGASVGTLLVLHDITARKRAEEELIRAQRLRAAGELSLGVSHNLNNILTAILAPADRLRQRYGEDADLAVLLDAAGRARDLVQQLGRSVDDSDTALQPVDVAAVVGEAIRAAQPRWEDEAQAAGRPIRLRENLTTVQPVCANESELYDALLNLLFNAVDALPEGGQIAIDLENHDNGVSLRISDDGIGMDEETRRRVFEPFFTTKAQVGTGLGLATVHAAVQRWGGDISVDSERGRGTTFRLTLSPWKGELPRERPAESARPQAPPATHGGRILVVEDEAVISMLLADSLRNAGHEVRVVSDGGAALKAFEPGRFEVALLDLGIPEVPGDELARRMTSQDPHLATVLLTGWHLGEDDPRRVGTDFYLQKPVALPEVNHIVARALGLHDDRKPST